EAAGRSGRIRRAGRVHGHHRLFQRRERAAGWRYSDGASVILTVGSRESGGGRRESGSQSAVGSHSVVGGPKKDGPRPPSRGPDRTQATPPVRVTARRPS